jgi:hypothetical protein
MRLTGSFAYQVCCLAELDRWPQWIGLTTRRDLIVLSGTGGRSAGLSVKAVAGLLTQRRITSDDVLSGRVMIAIRERVA